MIRLHTLGASRIARADGSEQDVRVQPKRLALLTYLAVASPAGAHRRATVLALFWPESDEQHARWALNQAVRQLRSSVEPSVIRTHGAATISVDPEVVWCDAAAFRKAYGEGDWSGALELYKGEFLKGLIVPDCHDLNVWLDETRARLRRMAATAAWSKVDELDSRGAIGEAIITARAAVRLAPGDEPAVRRLIGLLDAAGDRSGAVRVYEQFEEWLEANLGVAPAPETRAAIEGVKSRSTPGAVLQSPGSQFDSPGRGTSVDDEPVPSGPATSEWSVWFRRAAAGGVVAWLAFVGVGWLDDEGSPRDAPRSIAVIPCVYEPASAETPHLAEALIEDLNKEILRQRAFEKVIARQSMLRYRGTNSPPSRIGVELDVDALVYCEYDRNGSRERLRARVLDTRSGALLWAGDLTQQVDSAGQGLAARAAVGVAAAVGGVDPSSLPRVPTLPRVDPKALNLEKEGRYFLHRTTETSLRRSIQLFNRAIALDSSFARAHLGLGQAYQRLGSAFGGMEAHRAFPRMRDAAERALALEAGLAEAHELLGMYEAQYGWDWDRAEAELRRAVRLDPYSPAALQELGYVLTLKGRHEAVESLSHRALDLDPVNTWAWMRAAQFKFFNGRFAEAVPLLEKALELDPDFPPALLVSGLLLAEAGAPDRCIPYLQRADSITGHNPIIRGRLAYCYALAGDDRSARNLIAGLLDSYDGGHVDGKAATAIAAGYIGLADVDSAFHWLGVAYDGRSGNLVHLLRSPAGWRLAGDPRREELAGRIGLPLAIPARVDVPSATLLATSFADGVAAAPLP